MKRGIGKSVGLNGANEKDDVIFIQRALNAHAGCHVKSLSALVVDGKCGKNTRDAIEKFQLDYAGIKFPDSRVDPNGKTLRYLTMYLPEAFYTQPFKTEPKPVAAKIAPTPAAAKPAATQAAPSAAKAVAKPAAATAATVVAGLDHITVSYASDLPPERRIVSATAIKVVKMALKEAGLAHGVITSTIRSARLQAEIMYSNASANIRKQYELYGKYGDQVLDIFSENVKTKPRAEVIRLMEQEIIELQNLEYTVSNHCVSIPHYKRINVLDIGVNSTRSRNTQYFDKDKFTATLKDFQKRGLIKRFIDETDKSNSCWHLEISSSTVLPRADTSKNMTTSERYINE